MFVKDTVMAMCPNMGLLSEICGASSSKVLAKVGV